VLIKAILQSQDYDALVAWIDPVYFQSWSFSLRHQLSLYDSKLHLRLLSLILVQTLVGVCKEKLGCNSEKISIKSFSDFFSI
jgi:hypothetical protein